MFVSEDTVKKIASIHADASNHASIVAQAIKASQDEGSQPSTAVQQAFVRNAATAQIAGAMLACIEAGISLSEIRTMVAIDEIIEAESPGDKLDDFLGIEHLDFEAGAADPYMDDDDPWAPNADGQN